MEFDAVIEDAGGGGAFVRLPSSAAEEFGTNARVPVKATFNGVAYTGSAAPMGGGGFFMPILKAVRAEAGVNVGDSVHVVIERDTEPRTVALPEELAAALVAADLGGTFSALAFSHRKEYAQWVAEAKKPETRLRRADKAVEMLRKGEKLS
jgi:hypothetical protein